MSGSVDIAGARKSPDWRSFIIGLLLPLLAAAVAYGALQAKHEALSERVSRTEWNVHEVDSNSQERDRELRQQTKAMQETLEDVRRDLARICLKLGAGCKQN